MDPHAGQACKASDLEAYLGKGFQRGVLLDPHLGCVRAVRLVQHSAYPNLDKGHTVHFCIDDHVRKALGINRQLQRPVALWHCVGTRHHLRGPFLFRAVETAPRLRAVFRLDAASPPLRLPEAEKDAAPLRSLLERRWRRALGALGLAPQNEPCTYALPPPAGGSSTPDFSVRVAPFDTSVFIEIKPAFPATPRCAVRARGRAGSPLLLLRGACAPPLSKKIRPGATRTLAARGWLFRPDGTHAFPVVLACDGEEVLATWSPTLTGWDHLRARCLCRRIPSVLDG